MTTDYGPQIRNQVRAIRSVEGGAGTDAATVRIALRNLDALAGKVERLEQAWARRQQQQKGGTECDRA